MREMQLIRDLDNQRRLVIDRAVLQWGHSDNAVLLQAVMYPWHYLIVQNKHVFACAIRHESQQQNRDRYFKGVRGVAFRLSDQEQRLHIHTLMLAWLSTAQNQKAISKIDLASARADRLWNRHYHDVRRLIALHGGVAESGDLGVYYWRWLAMATARLLVRKVREKEREGWEAAEVLRWELEVSRAHNKVMEMEVSVVRDGKQQIGSKRELQLCDAPSDEPEGEDSGKRQLRKQVGGDALALEVAETDSSSHAVSAKLLGQCQKQAAQIDELQNHVVHLQQQIRHARFDGDLGDLALLRMAAI